MSTIYRRHRGDCPRRQDLEIRVPIEGDLFERRGEKRCACPLWVHGFIDGRKIQKSAGTRDWQKARVTVREWEASRPPERDEVQAIGIEAAEKEFLADCTARKLKKPSVDRYRFLFRELNAFAAEKGFRFLSELETPALNKFRATWKGSSGL